MKATRKKPAVSLDDLNPFELEGTAEDIALVEEGLSILARKQSVWMSVVDGWKRRAGIAVPEVPSVAVDTLAKSKADLAVATLPHLINAYVTHKQSNYQSHTPTTRRFYDAQMKRLVESFGDTELSAINKAAIEAVYNGWTSNRTEKIANGHAGIAILRVLVNFGATTLELPECVRLSVILRSMRTKMVRPRTERITAAHVIALRKKAREKGYPSIALAQALLFQGGLKQKQILGEWLSLSETNDPGNVVSDGKKWMPGLLWEEISSDWVLRRKLRDGSLLELDLKQHAMIMEDFAFLERKSAGAVLLTESTGLPWDAAYFRSVWRKLANECGIPKGIRSTDTPGESDESEAADDEEIRRASEAVASEALH